MRLYELGGEYAAAIEAYNSATSDEEQDVALKILESIESPFEEKIGNCHKILRDLKSEVESFDAEIDRLTQHKKSALRQLDNLKEYVKGCIQASGLPKPTVTTAIGKIWIQNNPPSVNVTVRPEDLPSEFRITIPAHFEADKKAILAAWKDGKEIAGAEVTQGTHLREN